MKEQMRKHHGYQPETLPTQQNFTSYSTSNTLISRACKTASRSHDSCWISMHQTYCRFFFSFFLFLSLSKGLFLLFFLSSSSRNSKNVSIPLFLLLSPLFLLSMFSLLLFILASVS